MLCGLLVLVFGLATALTLEWVLTLYVLVIGAVLAAAVWAIAAVAMGQARVRTVVAWTMAVLAVAWVAVTLVIHTSVTLRIIASGAVTLFVVGVGWRVVDWWRRPQPYKIPTTPAPATRVGALGRVLAELVIFRSLWRSQHLPGTGQWFLHGAFVLCAWLFHVAFALVVLRHLRYFLYPVPAWVEWFRTPGLWAGYVLAATAGALLIRRLVNAKEAYITLVSDYAALGLVLAIAGTGLLVHYHARMDLVQLKNFLLHALSFRMEFALNDKGEVIYGLQTVFNFWMVVHILSVLTLLAYFPYSKLMHGVGLVFNPTRNQANDVRVRRYVNPWNERVQV